MLYPFIIINGITSKIITSPKLIISTSQHHHHQQQQQQRGITTLLSHSTNTTTTTTTTSLIHRDYRILSSSNFPRRYFKSTNSTKAAGYITYLYPHSTHNLIRTALITFTSIFTTTNNYNTILPFHIDSIQTVRAFSTPSTTTTYSMTTSSTMETDDNQSTTTATLVDMPQPQQQQRPSLPFRYYKDDDNNSTQSPSLLQTTALDLTELSQQMSIIYQQKQLMYDTSRQIQNSIQLIRNHIGTDQAQVEIQQLLDTYSTTTNDNVNNNNNVVVLTHDKNTNRLPRIANLSYTIEDMIRMISYQYFLQTGCVIPPPLYVTDEEYLSGAIMGLCSDLQQYGLGRATIRDVHSVQKANHVVGACMEYLLTFDFRNGPLRRKYDGCKYSLKALETFLYELAVTSPSIPTDNSVKESIVIDNILPMKELIAIKERIDFRDNLRENLIKKCRDGQKLAKQCIFALHRNPYDRTVPQQLLQQCSKYIIEELYPIIQEEPPLRYGSYAAVLEEYVEAKLFYTWLHGRDCTEKETIRRIDPTSNNNNDTGVVSSRHIKVSGILLIPQDFMIDDMIQLQPEEYIGGLCDLTGEIGRFAVQRGTVRDISSIQQCWFSNTIIYNAIQSMDRISLSNGGGGGGSQPKKLDTVRSNVQKIERMLYEISLSEAAGHGRTIQTDAMIAVTTGLVDDE